MPNPPYTWKTIKSNHVYEINLTPNPHKPNPRKINIGFIGCQGKNDPEVLSQQRVGDLLKQLIIHRPDIEPDLMCGLGDSFYKKPPKLSTDPKWKINWLEPYEGIDKKFCMVLGNHDLYKIREEVVAQYAVDTISLAVNQISTWWSNDTIVKPVSSASDDAAIDFLANRTFNEQEGDPKIPEGLVAFFEQRKLDQALIPKWMLPFPFYSIIIDTLQIFFLNSNSYAKDYYALLKNPEVELKNPNNQAVWFQTYLEECILAKRTPWIAQHHGFGSKGKRAYLRDSDTYYYLSETQIKYLIDVISQAEIDMLKKCKAQKQALLKQLSTQKEVIEAELVVSDARIADIYQFYLVADAPSNATTEALNPIAAAEAAIEQLESEIEKIPGAIKKIDEAIETLQAPLHNPLLARLLMHQRLPHLDEPIFQYLKFAASAHDHDIYTMIIKILNAITGTTYTLGQLISGGGGGDIHYHEYFGDYHEIENLVFFGEYGAAIASYDPENPNRVEVEIFTIPRSDTKPGKWFHHHVKTVYENGAWKIIREPSLDARVEEIRKFILQGCYQYQKFLHHKQEERKNDHIGFFSAANLTHTVNSVREMHDLVNYLQQPQLPPAEEFFTEVNELLNKITNKTSTHSLYLNIIQSFRSVIEDQSLTLVQNLQTACEDKIAALPAWFDQLATRKPIEVAARALVQQFSNLQHFATDVRCIHPLKTANLHTSLLSIITAHCKEVPELEVELVRILSAPLMNDRTAAINIQSSPYFFSRSDSAPNNAASPVKSAISWLRTSLSSSQ